jgi:hypothetical protein
MRRVHLIMVCTCSIAASAAAGNLWIHCEPGLEISIDGESVGVCDEAGHVSRVSGLEAGDHIIRVEGEGGAAATFALPVGRASTQVVIPELTPSGEGVLTESEEAHESPPVGILEITSNPRTCEIDLAGRGIRKRQPIVMFLGLPVGEYEILFTSSEVKLRAEVTVRAAQTVRAMADFSSQRVAVTSPESSSETEPKSDEHASREEAECIVFWIQVMRTDNFEAIEPMQSILRDLGFPDERQKVITIEEEGAPPIYKLRVGPIERANIATWAAGQIRNAGIPSVWVLPKECDPSYKPPKRGFKPVPSGG